MEPIPIEILQAARLKFKRRLASGLVLMLAEREISYAAMDEALGKKSGWSRRYIIRLMDGTTSDLDVVSDLAFALGCEIDWSFALRERAERTKT